MNGHHTGRSQTARPYRPHRIEAAHRGQITPSPAPARQHDVVRELLERPTTAVTRSPAPYPSETADGLSTTERIHRELFSHLGEG